MNENIEVNRTQIRTKTFWNQSFRHIQIYRSSLSIDFSQNQSTNISISIHYVLCSLETHKQFYVIWKIIKVSIYIIHVNIYQWNIILYENDSSCFNPLCINYIYGKFYQQIDTLEFFLKKLNRHPEFPIFIIELHAHDLYIILSHNWSLHDSYIKMILGLSRCIITSILD